MASLEGKAVVSPHPSRFLTAADTAAHIRGHVQGVRRGPDLPSGEASLCADLVVFDPVLIAGIRDGSTRERSLGYDTEYRPLENGDFEQRNLSYNHCALVAVGRAGERVAVLDSSEDEMIAS